MRTPSSERRRRQLDATARAGELEGVREQVAHHLVDPVHVPLDLVGESVGHRHAEVHAALHGEHVERALQLVEQVGEADRPWIDASAPRLEAGDVEQMGGETRQRLALRLDGGEHLGLLGGQRSVDPVLHELKIAEDDVDRRLQLVRRDRDELGLQLVELGQLLAHRAKAHGQPSELVDALGGEIERRLQLSLRDGAHALARAPGPGR